MGKKLRAVFLTLLLCLAMFGVLDFSFDIIEIASGDILYVNITGSGGAYTSIQDAVNVSSEGDTVFVYNGTYYENVLVNKTISLVGENKENTVIDGGGNEDVIRITVDWVNITGFTVMQSGKGSGYAGIELTEVQECRIYSNHLTNTSYGIYLSSSHCNNIDNNFFFANNQSGIRVSYSIRNNINNNFFSKMGSVLYRRYSINLYHSNETYVSDNMMIGEGIYISGDLLANWNTHNIDVSNTLNGKPLYYWKNQTAGKIPSGAGQVILANCTNINIENQTLMNGSFGISLGFSSCNNISNNFVLNNFEGIYLWHSDRNNITRNNVSNNVWGIMTYFSTSNNISSNFVSNNQDGIYLIESDKNNITNNTSMNNYQGINLYYSNDNEIVGNYLTENGQFCIMVAYSDYNNNTGNKIFKNFIGIRLYYCGWNKIIGNTISHSKWYGIKYTYELSSLDNWIYHNNFISNLYQAYDDYPLPFRNHWDNGYPDGGNFWSDYTGSDKFNGPNQDINGSDGIGDSPYEFAINSMVLYPLMAPYGDYIYLYQGWNLISIPFIQPDTFISSVFKSIEGSYDALQSYNATDFTDHWKHNSTKKPSHLNDLDKIDHTMGFWIHITEPGGVLFQYPGTKSTENQTINIHLGWNLIGYPSQTCQNRTKGLNNLTFENQVDAIWTYDSSSQKWIEMGKSDNFKFGRGYYIHAKIECVWEVPL
ncbi:MAG: right-handed parallel beta-helix repeat-containing protein [Thermoplasmata archaeon]|nr:MAG: right-handed parallel beta-helix repeat-containing protein [Thermoplasmata archaeon]